MEHEARWEAIERAYREHADDVYRVAYAILRDPDAAADLTQEAFARAFASWERYDPSRPLRPWLQAIVAHLALDGLRRERVRRLAAPLLALQRGARPGDDDPGPRALAGHEIEEALGRLRPRARAAVVLRHYYGYGYEEIAALLGTTPGNVGVLLSRAHADLRHELRGSAPAITAAGERAPRR